MGNTGNISRNIGNVFTNHITVIENIDIELLSSPKLYQYKNGFSVWEQIWLIWYNFSQNQET